MQCGVLLIGPDACLLEAGAVAGSSASSAYSTAARVEAITSEHAKIAGALRRTSTDAVGAIDANVVETAARRGSAVVTSDRSDIEQLVGAARRRLQVIDIRQRAEGDESSPFVAAPRPHSSSTSCEPASASGERSGCGSAQEGRRRERPCQRLTSTSRPAHCRWPGFRLTG
jgi:hypothetical protein